jgi:hypothetical protein
MGIRIEAERFIFECDGCDDVLDVNEHSVIEATSEARVHGWGTLHLSGRVQEWYCPTCALKLGAD